MSRPKLILGALVSAVAIVGGLLYSQPATAQEVPSGGSLYFAVTPVRIADTWNSVNTALSSIAGGESRPIQVTGVADIPATGVEAVVIDVAGTSTADASLYAFPDGGSRTQSFLSFDGDGRPSSNSVIVKPGANGKVRIYNSAGDTDINVDIQGYFAETGGGAKYVSIAPSRLVGTNTGIGLPLAKIVGGSTQTVQIAGLAGIPVDATAVFANVRVLNANVHGGVRIGASDQDLSSAPYAINYAANEYTDTGMTIKLGPDGKAKVSSPTPTSSLDLLVDVQGYFHNGSGERFNTLGNAQIFDTHSSSPLAAGEARQVTAAGKAGVPTGPSVEAVAVTITATQWGNSGTISVYSSDGIANGTSNLAVKSPNTSPKSSTSIVELGMKQEASQSRTTPRVRYIWPLVHRAGLG